ncbi:MAG: hypothetical protein ABSE04_01265 [Candidatus Microgenomates bacterium]|jgi:hypothetical protein
MVEVSSVIRSEISRHGWPATEKLDKIDSLRVTAERRIRAFREFMGKNVTGRQDATETSWTKVRDYKRDGESFNFGAEPFALDSIVVEKSSSTLTADGSERIRRTYCWISTEKDKKWGLPFIYIANEGSSGKGGTEFSEVRLIPYMFKTQLDATNFARTFLRAKVLTEPSGHVTKEIEVWKPGKSEKEEGKEQAKSMSGIMQPIPIPES